MEWEHFGPTNLAPYDTPVVVWLAATATGRFCDTPYCVAVLRAITDGFGACHPSHWETVYVSDYEALKGASMSLSEVTHWMMLVAPHRTESPVKPVTPLVKEDELF